MFEAPDSHIKHIVIDRDVILERKPAMYFTKEQVDSVAAAVTADDRQTVVDDEKAVKEQQRMTQI
jgi:hypothetical protein